MPHQPLRFVTHEPGQLTDPWVNRPVTVALGTAALALLSTSTLTVPDQRPWASLVELAFMAPRCMVAVTDDATVTEMLAGVVFPAISTARADRVRSPAETPEESQTRV